MYSQVRPGMQPPEELREGEPQRSEGGWAAVTSSGVRVPLSVQGAQLVFTDSSF